MSRILTGLPFKKTFDADRLAEDLKAAGVDTLPAATLKELFAISRKSKGPEADQVRALKEEVSDLADHLEEVALAEGEKILMGEEAAAALEEAREALGV